MTLFVLLFFPWYDVKISGSQLSLPDTSEGGRTAWGTLELVTPLLALASVCVLGVVIARRVRPGWRPAIAPGAAIAVLGGLATLLVLFRVLAPPDLGAVGGIGLEGSPSLGAFLGLAAALGVAVGGYRAMREEGSSFAAVADALRPPRERPASRRR